MLYWWMTPQTLKAVKKIDPIGSHASWMENFPWTRLSNAVAPEGGKPLIDFKKLNISNPQEYRAMLGDGNFGGDYQKSDEDMLKIWQAGVAETREALEDSW